MMYNNAIIALSALSLINIFVIALAVAAMSTAACLVAGKFDNVIRSHTPVFYVKNWPSKNFDGVAFGVLILINHDKKGDKGLLAHEQQHCVTMLKTLYTCMIRYAFSKKYRLKFVIEAHAMQAFTDKSDWLHIDSMASGIIAGYNVGSSRKLVRAMLFDAVEKLKVKHLLDN